jgi:hypothetical protein
LGFPPWRCWRAWEKNAPLHLQPPRRRPPRPSRKRLSISPQGGAPTPTVAEAPIDLATPPAPTPTVAEAPIDLATPPAPTPTVAEAPIDLATPPAPTPTVTEAPIDLATLQELGRLSLGDTAIIGPFEVTIQKPPSGRPGGGLLISSL